MADVTFPADLVTYSERAAYVRGLALRDELLPHLERCAFLLNSARLVITDDTARAIAAEAVKGAQAAIERAAS
jgi:hypothetical protein